jgi:hypothetical protein
MVRISIELSPEEADQLREAARPLGIEAEKLARVALVDWLSRSRADFEAAADYVLNKNKELYERLAK